ncbi:MULTISPECIES: LysR family transcriptional regulator [unclassified Streptomyces]|uniref:LysR family transcriptional regulator n=1 Tax=unclassified Streptomyces TaxID=2593676 RepID=UPI002258BD9A|nr:MULTISPECIES: LysR family transcriptional regulator [unclassified Streptomyces]MCX4642022.1 LysR family transcriptional regulator [Streptomyces sp. NBC_01446]MCX5085754.1 LysR family transcriptional regulator [Streptomyces sp. NBC_00401]MCX5326895.1 LysR family transcriptional regulator [Streptomyces sp. NBC_00120]
MELRELEWFNTLAETENMTAASARLNISQPTLSRALARLERKLGVKLFDRRQNRLQLNRYGAIFQAHAMRAMNELSKAEERISTLVDPDQGQVSLGFLNSFGEWLIPDLVNRYRDLAPRTSFELRGAASDTVTDDVRQGRIDIGFVAPEPTAEDLDWTPLGLQRLSVGVPAGHRFADRGHVTIADLEDEPMVALRVGYGLRHITERLCRQAGFSPQIVIEATDLYTLPPFVLAGWGVAIVPEPQPGQQTLTPVIPIDDPSAFRPYGMLTRRGGPGGQAARRFMAFVTARPKAMGAPQEAAPQAAGVATKAV